MSMLRKISTLLLSCIVVLTAGVASAGTLTVELVLSDGSSPYRQFAESFNRTLSENKAEVTVAESNGSVNSRAGLIVAVGMKASELAVAQSGTPVLAVMIPDTGLRALLEQPSRKIPARLISSIYLNQPWDRQLDFLQAALPEHRRIGLLHSPDTMIDLDDLRRQIARRGSSLAALAVPSTDKLFASLESVFEKSDLLLAVPDAAIYNSNSIRNILLASYRRSIPLIGLSQPYVSAGALCAIFSTTEQLAGQAGAAVIAFSRNGRLPEPQYPAAFTIAVNPQVARSLSIDLPSEKTILGRMDRSQAGKPGGRER